MQNSKMTHFLGHSVVVFILLLQTITHHHQG